MDWASLINMGSSGPAARVTIALDKSAYSAGDLVRGRVTLAVFRDMIADELVVQFRGDERLSWLELVTEGGGHHHKSSHKKRKKQRTKTNAFLRDEIVVFSFPRALAVGSYEFPFAYQSHASLPGVFAMDPHHHSDQKRIRDLRASITYSVRAKLDEGFFLDCWNAHARCDLVLHELPKIGIQYGDSSYSSGSYDAKSQTVRLLSLLDQGKCELAASLGKAVYRAGESATLQYHIKNASLLHIRALKVSLFQDVYLQLSKRNSSEPISRKVVALEFAGVAAESEVRNFLSFALRGSDGRELSPSTNGALVKCRYRVHVQCDIRWCPDPCLDLPIVISAMPTAPEATAPVLLGFDKREREAAMASGIH